MSRRGEVKEMAQAIIEHNDGQAYFNIQEASKIVGCGRNTLIAGLTDAGISVSGSSAYGNGSEKRERSR